MGNASEENGTELWSAASWSGLVGPTIIGALGFGLNAILILTGASQHFKNSDFVVFVGTAAGADALTSLNRAVWRWILFLWPAVPDHVCFIKFYCETATSTLSFLALHPLVSTPCFSSIELLQRYLVLCQGDMAEQMMGTPLKRRIWSLLPLLLVILASVAALDGVENKGANGACWVGHSVFSPWQLLIWVLLLFHFILSLYYTISVVILLWRRSQLSVASTATIVESKALIKGFWAQMLLPFVLMIPLVLGHIPGSIFSSGYVRTLSPSLFYLIPAMNALIVFALIKPYRNALSKAFRPTAIVSIAPKTSSQQNHAW